MKISNFLFFVLITFAFSSCGSSNNDDPDSNQAPADSNVTGNKSVDSLTADVSGELDGCGHRSIQDFSQFLSFNYGDQEEVITSKLGAFSSGNFSPDSAYFIYYFNQIKTVPIQVWVNAKTGKILTVFIEVLSLGDAFNADIAKAKENYEFSSCDLSWFGLTADQLVEKLGKPAEDAVSREDVRLISYDSPDFHIGVAFKIFPQAPVCSSISVNWFYEE